MKGTVLLDLIGREQTCSHLVSRDGTLPLPMFGAMNPGLRRYWENIVPKRRSLKLRRLQGRRPKPYLPERDVWFLSP
jgi:hypothetical protein